MSTTVVWNDAAPPATAGEHMAAEWLVMIARQVGLASVTADNTGEWLWRFAFLQEMAGRRFGEYERDVWRFEGVLDRFCGATLEGRVGEQDRDAFISEHVANRVECAREQADGVALQWQEQAAWTLGRTEMNADPLESMREVHRQALADGMVKVGIPMDGEGGGSEWCFAKRLSASHARLDNVPVFCDGVHYGDVVEFREQDPPHELFKDFVRVVTQGSGTLVLPFGNDCAALPPDEWRRRFLEVRERLLALPKRIRPLAVERVANCWVSIALPHGLKRRQVAAVAAVVVPPDAED